MTKLIASATVFLFLTAACATAPTFRRPNMIEISEYDLPVRVPGPDWKVIKNAKVGLSETAFDVLFVHRQTGANVGCLLYPGSASPPLVVAANLGKRLKRSGASVTPPVLTGRHRGDAVIEFSFNEHGRQLNGKTVVIRLERLGSDTAIVTGTWVENDPAGAPYVLNALLQDLRGGE